MNNKFIKIKGNDSLVRDAGSKAIINNNSVEFHAALKSKEVSKRNNERLNDLENKVNRILFLLENLNKE